MAADRMTYGMDLRPARSVTARFRVQAERSKKGDGREEEEIRSCTAKKNLWGKT